MSDDKVTMTAKDTFHASNVSSNNLLEGDVFLVSERDAKELESRGLAERGGSASKAVNADSFGSPSGRPETREEIDAEREGKAIKAAPENKAHDKAPISAVTAPAKTKAKAKKG